MRKVLAVFMCAGLLLAACEEGPEQIYTPNPKDTNFDRFNGWKQLGFRETGDQPFEWETSGQAEGTTVICQADELADRWSKMVKADIEPTVGAGGLNLRGENWAGLTVDDAQQQLCQAYVYSSEMVFWGDNAELIAFYDTKNRLINRLVTLTGYEGTIKAGGFEIANNKPITKDGKDLVNPTSDANLKAMNSAMLKVFRPEVTNPDQRDCVTLNTCYVMEWYTLKRFVFQDLWLDFAIEPEGSRIDHIGINLWRTFDLSTSDVSFETSPAPTTGLPPMPKIKHSSSCNPTLGVAWSHITDNCLGIDPPEKALNRPVWGNEAMMADMGGLGVYMVRPNMPKDKVFADTDKAAPTDKVVGLAFDTAYEGKMVIGSGNLYQGFFTEVANAVLTLDPKLDLGPRFATISPKVEANKLGLGTQKIDDCYGGTCEEHTLTIRTREIVLEELQQLQQVQPSMVIPDQIKDPNFYVEILLREILKVFNGNAMPDPDQVYFFLGDATAQTLYGVMVRMMNGKRYGVRVAYHNLSDQLLFLFFKEGALRTEEVLLKDAELSGMQNGSFSLWKLATSNRLGLAKKLLPTLDQDGNPKVMPEIRKAMISVDIPAPTEVMVDYHAQDSLSGYAVPLEGKRDLFVPASYFGFAGTVVGAGIWADGDSGIIKAISSGVFYDQLDFCGVKVGLYDPVDSLIKNLPADCEKILSYSENGKILTAMSTYVQETPFKIGLRLWITADRIDGAYYWAEE